MDTPDRNRAHLRERMTAIEQMEDGATIRALERIGVGPGWRCLEIAAGGGSIARWLCRRVGTNGQVVATDTEDCFLRELDDPRLEIRKHDVTRDPLETRAFDLVHARNLLANIPGRLAALKQMAAAVKPGGWILIEEPDFVTVRADPAAPPALRGLYQEFIDLISRFARLHGIDLNFGGRVYGLFRALGFEDLEAVGHTRMFRGDPATSAPQQLAFAGFKQPLVAGGRVSERDFDNFMALYDNPEFAWLDSLRIASWGRRPVASGDSDSW